MRPVILTLALILLPGSTLFAQYDVGDNVTVIHDYAPIMLDKKVLQEVGRGLNLKVGAVSGNLLWVSHTSTGWISRQHVTTPDKAIDVITEQIRQNPQDSRGYVARGLTWHSRGENDIAIGDFDQAIRLDPKNSYAYGNRANCWSKKGDVDKSIVDSTEAIRLEPKYAVWYCIRADGWNTKSEFAKAIADATEAIRLAPKFSAAYQRRGAGWAGKKEWDKAISDYGEAISIDPNDANSRAGRAWTWSQKKEFDKAIAEYGEAIKVDPKSAYSYNAIAWICATSPDARYRNGPKAIEQALKSCSLDSWKDASHIDTLAAAYAEAGDFKNAVEWQIKAIGVASATEKAELEAHLDLFKSGKPYRDESRK